MAKHFIERCCYGFKIGPALHQQLCRIGPPLTELHTTDDLLMDQRISAKQRYRWHGVGPPPDAADDLLVAQSFPEAVLPIASSWPIYCLTRQFQWHPLYNLGLARWLPSKILALACAVSVLPLSDELGLAHTARNKLRASTCMGPFHAL